MANRGWVGLGLVTCGLITRIETLLWQIIKHPRLIRSIALGHEDAGSRGCAQEYTMSQRSKSDS